MAIVIDSTDGLIITITAVGYELLTVSVAIYYYKKMDDVIKKTTPFLRLKYI